MKQGITGRTVLIVTAAWIAQFFLVTRSGFITPGMHEIELPIFLGLFIFIFPSSLAHALDESDFKRIGVHWKINSIRIVIASINSGVIAYYSGANFIWLSFLHSILFYLIFNPARNLFSKPKKLFFYQGTESAIDDLNNDDTSKPWEGILKYVIAFLLFIGSFILVWKSL